MAPGASWGAVRLGGWPVSAETVPVASTYGGGTASAEVATPGLRSRVRDLRGFGGSGVTTEQGTSPLGRWTAVPWLTSSEPVTPGEVLAASVLLDRGAAEAASDPLVSVQPLPDGAHSVTIVWADDRRTVVTLPAPA
jgi:hypothetical protein